MGCVEEDLKNKLVRQKKMPFLENLTGRINSLKAIGASIVVQWLRIHAFIPGVVGLIQGQGTKIPHAVQCGQNINK